MSKSGKVFNEKKTSQSGMFNTLNLPDQLLITHYSLFITHSPFQPISTQKNFPRATHY
jgi:hypothetical protein